MSLIVGTNTYLSIADADSYWSERNNAIWAAADDADKEKALREATQYIDGAFTFIGHITEIDQKLAWPRSSVIIKHGNFRGQDIDTDVIPEKVEQATAELALEALSARLVPAENRGGKIKREKVDVIEVEYLDWAPSGKTFEFVSMLLRPFTIGSKSQVKLMRT